MERGNRECWFREERAAILSGEVREGSLEGAIWARLEGGEKVARRRSGERVLKYRHMSKSEKEDKQIVKGIFGEE